MNVRTEARPMAASPAAPMKIIDCDIHPTMPDDDTARRYLPKEWHEFYALYRNYQRGPLSSMDLYPGIDPHSSRRDSYPLNGGPPGSDLEFMRSQHLDPHNIEFGVLQPLRQNGVTQRNVQYGAALCSAVNEWQASEWTDNEPRLRSSLMVTPEDAEAAVEELKQRGADARFAMVLLFQRAVEPLGRRRYWPIYRLAQEYDLPLGIHTGGNSGAPALGGAGWASFQIQQHQTTHSAMASVLTSLVLEGVFEEFPRLKILMIEGAFSWLPSLTWRLDKVWHRMRSEMPNVKRPPSEYIRKHVWMSSQPIDVFKKPEDLQQIVDWMGWDRLCFATDYPHWDFDHPQQAFPIQMTAEQRTMVFNRNARNVLRL